MTIECFIIDNQPLNIKILESYINRTPFFKSVGCIDSCEAYLSSKIQSDILLVNVDMIKNEEAYHLDSLKQLIVFMLRAPKENYDLAHLQDISTSAGFLQLPATYPLFLQEIERLIK